MSGIYSFQAQAPPVTKFYNHPFAISFSKIYLIDLSFRVLISKSHSKMWLHLFKLSFESVLWPQAIMYVLCFRMRSILDVPRFRSQLTPLESILMHKLNPLRVSFLFFTYAQLLFGSVPMYQMHDKRILL